MINNISLIKGLLKFDNEDDFYHCQILKRKKEHPELGSNSYVVKTYFIKKLEDIDNYIGEMICLANYHNARVCINLNRRSFEKCAFQTLRKVADQIMNKDWRSVRKAYTSVCGNHSNELNKRWIIDIDDRERYKAGDIASKIFDIQPEGGKVIAEIPTKNGYHLIVSPFNLQDFKREFPELDVHKDNPTIIYTP